MITLTNVSKYYQNGKDSSVVLSDVSLEIPKNQRLGILADTRAGRSTVTRLLAGVEQPDEGVITRLGTTSWPLGFAGGFHADLTGEENVRMIAAVHNLEEDPMCLFCFEMSELGDTFYQPVRKYSSGMRAALAFVMSHGL